MMMIRSWRAFIPVLAFIPSFAVVLIVAAPTKAQTDASPGGSARTNTMPVYDVTKEVKIRGTIQKVDNLGSNGPLGTHILIQTARGIIDAHLGSSAASKPEYLGISQGQRVTLTGMMQNFGGSDVLMARILTTSNHIFVLRNEQGIPVRAIPRGSPPARTFFGSGFKSINPETQFSSGFASVNPETLGGL